MDPILVAGATSFITTLATKGAEGPGKTLDLAWNYVFYDVDKYLKAGIAKKESIQDFQSEIKENLQSISNENIQPPRKSIITTAMESSKHHLDEPEIRKMFSKLISNAFDSSLNSHMHPSYNEIIKQLSPADALMLNNLEKRKRTPIVNYVIKVISSGGTIDLSDFFCLPLLNDYNQTVISINNLERLKLIKIGYGEHLADETAYQEFNSPSLIQKIIIENDTVNLKAKIDLTNGKNPAQTLISDDVDINKSFIDLTSYGKSFFNIFCR